MGGRGRAGEATRYKFPDIRPFVSFEMGQFSRDLMVIAFLGGHIAFHPVQCVRPIYQSSSLSRLGLSLDQGWLSGEGEGVDVAKRRRGEREGSRNGVRERERGRERGCVYVCACVVCQRG